jgi:hypothetical protein
MAAGLALLLGLATAAAAQPTEPPDDDIDREPLIYYGPPVPPGVDAFANAQGLPAGVTVRDPAAPGTPAPPTAPPADPEPPRPVGPLGEGGTLATEALAATLGDELDADQHPVAAKAVFPADTKMVHLLLDIRAEPPGGMVLLTWYRETEVVERQAAPMAAGEVFLFTCFSGTQEHLPTGRWRVTIEAGRTPLGTLPFTIGP